MNINDISDNTSKEDFHIINAHTHTFLKDHTPRYMAKQILPWPFYKWIVTGYMVDRIKAYLNRNKHEYTYPGRNKLHKDYRQKKFWTKTPAITGLYYVFLTLVWLIFAYYLFDLIREWFSDTILGWLFDFYVNLLKPIMPDLRNSWNVVFLLLIIVLAFPNVQGTLKKYIWGRIQKAIGKERLEFLLRYINIVRFTSNKGQAYIFNSLEQQYPIGTKFVVLPMDMEYMDAGPVEVSYPNQMDEVLKLKKNNWETCYPFIFVDPRRIEADLKNEKVQIPSGKGPETIEKKFLSLNSDDPDNIIMEDCLVNDYIIGGCVGIKIYPALGYYVFDKNLLKLWLYCQQNDIPITTHCSIGPVYYRGKLKDLGEKYDYHPIFDEVYEKDDNTEKETIGQMRFHELRNKDFQKNFTHPLNYLCLIHKPLLIKVIERFDNGGDLKTLFGYANGDIARDLSQLKINLAHYGSAEMWDQFLRQDRYREANSIIKDSELGLDLKLNIGIRAKLYSYWHWVDWFSIISSMIMQFDNVYTDVSYTSHDLKYMNLLSEILDHPKIAKRVLFGTDFYVVSNHKTEKQYWIDMQHSLGAGKWALIASKNPTEFLKSQLSESP